MRTKDEYMDKEHVTVEWIPIQSANVKYIQIFTNNRTRKFEPEILNNHFVSLPTTSPSNMHLVKGKHSGVLQDVNDFVLRTIVRYFDWSSEISWSYTPNHR